MCRTYSFRKSSLSYTPAPHLELGFGGQTRRIYWLVYSVVEGLGSGFGRVWAHWGLGPVARACAARTAPESVPCRTPLHRIAIYGSKFDSRKILSTFGDTCPRYGSKNGLGIAFEGRGVAQAPAVVEASGVGLRVEGCGLRVEN